MKTYRIQFATPHKAVSQLTNANRKPTPMPKVTAPKVATSVADIAGPVTAV